MGEILGFLETLRSLQLVVVIVVCSVVFFCVLLLRGSCLQWCPTVTTGCSGCSQFAWHASTMLKFLLLYDFAGAVAPDSFREPLRLVLLVVNLVFVGFLFVLGVLPVLPKF